MARTPKSTDGQTGPAKAKRPSTKKPNGDSRIPADEVARKAYEIYEARGGQHGLDMDDWYEAERQLKSSNRTKTKEEQG